MHDFFLKKLYTNNLETEILSIGFDKNYAKQACSKFEYQNFKIFDLTVAQANILKQTALSVGADCATHKEVITGKAQCSDCILGGSFAQLNKIAQKLEFQPFGLKNLGEKIKSQLNTTTHKTKIMGILNVTKDSFSDGGDFYDREDGIKHLNQLIQDGADIIDIGAESTRPNSEAVCAKDQFEKLFPILEYINNNNIKVPISIDTRNSEVAQKCIELGANIINDVSGFDYDPQMPIVLAQNPNVKIVIQHSSATPDVMQNYTNYENLTDDIIKNLHSKTIKAIELGIKPENIILDPGIGFGKTKEQNFEIIKRFKEFQSLGYPVMIGLSRKSLLNMPNKQNEEKDIYTLALNSILINENIDYIRVHNVKLHKNLINIMEGNN